VENVLVSVEPRGGAGKALTIGEGRGVVLFADLTLDASMRPPKELRHLFSFCTPQRYRAPIATGALGSRERCIEPDKDR
jgi:hypothetical protein